MTNKKLAELCEKVCLVESIDGSGKLDDDTLVKMTNNLNLKQQNGVKKGKPYSQSSIKIYVKGIRYYADNYDFSDKSHTYETIGRAIANFDEKNIGSGKYDL